MTLAQLKQYILDQLVAPVNSVTKIINVFNAVVDYFTGNTVSTLIPDWNAALTFQTDGAGAGKFCLYTDTDGKKRIFETKVDDNINHAPPSNPAITENDYWIEVSQAGSSAIVEWEPKVYGAGLVIVFWDHSTDGPGFYKLNAAARPYSSSDIETEFSSGDWVRAGGTTVANASETAKGVFEEATDSETQAGTATGSTSAKLAVTPPKLATWWTWAKTQAQTFANMTVTTFKLSGQAASSGVKNPLHIDDTGAVAKTSHIEVDTANKSVTETGKDTLATLIRRWRNSALQSVLEIYNDYTVKFGGTSAFFRVPSSIAAGNAGFIGRDVEGIILRFKDESSVDFVTLEKLSSGQKISRFRRPIVRDQSHDFPVFEMQDSITTSTTNSAQNSVVTISVPTDRVLFVNVRFATAIAPDGSVVTRDPFAFTAKNIAGVLTIDSSGSAVHRPLPNTLTANFSVTTSGTDVILRIQNEAVGKAYRVWLDYELVLIQPPV